VREQAGLLLRQRRVRREPEPLAHRHAGAVAVELHVGREADQHRDLAALGHGAAAVKEGAVDGGEGEQLLRLQLVLRQQRQLEPLIVDVDLVDEAAAHRALLRHADRLAERRVLGEEAPPLGRQLARAVAAVVHGALQRGQVGEGAKTRRHADDGELRPGGRAAEALWRRRRGGRVLLKDGVRVGPAKAEGGEAGAPRRAVGDLGPRRLRRDDVLVERAGQLWRRRDDAVLHREEQLARARKPGRGEGVAARALGRAEKRQLRGAKELAHRVELAHVALRRARRVALDVLRRRLGQPKLGVRLREALVLRLRVRLERQAAASVRDVRAEQHAVDAVAVALGVGQPLHHKDGAALARREPARLCVEGRRGAALLRRQRLEGGEA